MQFRRSTSRGRRALTIAIVGVLLGLSLTFVPRALVATPSTFTAVADTQINSSKLATTTSTTPPAADPVLVAAGDISTHTVTGGNKLTSDLVLSINPDLVLTLGDNQYTDGTLQEFQTYYDPTWGRFKARTRPGVGNHEYYSDPTAAGYYTYFGQAASPQDPSSCQASCKGYYSFDLGAWHVIALNSSHNDCAYVACGPGSEQIAWLQADLAANTKACVLAYWHHPRWSSGTHHGSDPTMATFWQTLYGNGSDPVDVILNGHEHNYERFAKLDPTGAPNPQGMRQFVVGTGGNALYEFGTPLPTSEARDATSKGVLKLTLHATSYDWEFVPAAGSSFQDAGTASCN
jgi:acid phosphatase type 7